MRFGRFGVSTASDSTLAATYHIHQRFVQSQGWKSNNNLSIKIAQKPYAMGSSGPKALKHESLECKGNHGMEADRAWESARQAIMVFIDRYWPICPYFFV